MGSCSANKKILVQIKTQDEQLAHLINLNQKLTECLNTNNSKMECSVESPEFRSYKTSIDDRFNQLENQISQIYCKLKKLNIFGDEIQEFTEIDDVQMNSFEKALENDFKTNNIQNVDNFEQEKSEKIEKSVRFTNNSKKPPRKTHQHQPSNKHEIKNLRSKNASIAISQQATEQSNTQQQKKGHRNNKSTKKINLNSDDFIKLTKTSKLSDQLKEINQGEEYRKALSKRDFNNYEKKKTKESQV